MSDCEGGPASDHRQLIGMAAMKIHPLGAQPKRANPTAPKRRPANNDRRSPNRFTNGPTRTAEANTDAMPTTASAIPIVFSSQE